MPTSPDDYAKQYMEGGRALAHSRVRMSRVFLGLMALVAVATLVSGLALLASANPAAAVAPLGVSFPLVVLTTLLFSHLRLTVTPTHVVVQYGLFGPKIPIDQVTRVEVEAYEWKKYGGWGMKRARDGTLAYSVTGAGERVVRLHYTDDAGRERKIVVSTDDPEGIVAAVEQARAAAAVRTRVATDHAAAVGPRVDVTTDDAAGDEVEVRQSGEVVRGARRR